MDAGVADAWAGDAGVDVGEDAGVDAEADAVAALAAGACATAGLAEAVPARASANVVDNREIRNIAGARMRDRPFVF
ncbi:hypothetical protein [Achromobacter xylosoxidans]|uniref:hypothetical protein n=1 Tax=Alcaligenes xylosoxydans xylosoxydans TaxID=85698 RepID=UPI001F5F0B69|nr:hypothetical protein [Achromobacter xylosoxidans]